MVLCIAVYRVNLFEHLLLKSSESEMPPIRLKDKYSEHFSLGTDDDGTTTVAVGHYCASKLSYHGSTSSMRYHFESRVGVTL